MTPTEEGANFVSVLAQLIADRLRKKGTDVNPAMVEFILRMRDELLSEDENLREQRFKQTKRIRGGRVVRDDDQRPPF